MATHREAKHATFSYVESMPWPKDEPQVEEVGATSAPLKSIAFFFGQYCKPYSDDFMLCKNENRNPEHCLLEGRRVTRCAQDLCVRESDPSIQKIGDKCGQEWDAHWQCLEQNNQVRARDSHQAYMPCRKFERPLNKCVLEQLVCLFGAHPRNWSRRSRARRRASPRSTRRPTQWSSGCRSRLGTHATHGGLARRGAPSAPAISAR